MQSGYSSGDKVILERVLLRLKDLETLTPGNDKTFA